MTDPGRRCAVLGHPIGHSLSPVLHRTAYAELGLHWEYDAVDVREDELADFLDRLDGSWRGLSLTMPLKRAVVPLLDAVSEVAERAQAANTVVLERGRRVGHNTDVPGVAAALAEGCAGLGERSVERSVEQVVERVVVLGGGATAASVLLAVADLGCREAVLAVREPSRAAGTLAAVSRHPTPPQVQVRALGEPDPQTGGVDLLVSTLPGTAQDERAEAAVESAGAVFDVSYDPWPSRVARVAEARGVPVVGGLDLLVHQAVLQVGLMTTGHGARDGTPVRVEAEAVLAAMRAALPSR